MPEKAIILYRSTVHTTHLKVASALAMTKGHHLLNDFPFQLLLHLQHTENTLTTVCIGKLSQGLLLTFINV